MGGVPELFEEFSKGWLGDLKDREHTWPEARFQGRILALLLLLALVLRILSWKLTAVMFNDGPTFIGIAQSFHEGRWAEAFAADFHPAYSFFVYLTYFLIPNWELAGVTVSILAGTLSVGWLYLFLRHAFGLRLAWIGTLIYAVQPYAVRFSADVQSEGLYLLFFIGGIALLWQAFDEERWGLAAGAGVSSALAYLTRPEGLGIVIVGFMIVAIGLARRQQRLGPSLVGCTVLLLSAFVVMSPYVALLHAQEGSLTLTKKKSLVRLAHIESVKPSGEVDSIRSVDPADKPERTFEQKKKRLESRRERQLRKWKAKYQINIPLQEAKPRAPWKNPPEERAQSFTGRAVESLRFILLGTCDVLHECSSRMRVEIMLAIIGILFLGFQPGKRALFHLAFPLLYFPILLSLRVDSGYVSGRHVFPGMILLSGYAALGVPVLGSLLLHPFFRGRQVSEARMMRMSLGLGLAILLCFSLGKQLRPHRESKLAERQVAEWLQARELPEGPVFTGRSRLAFYAATPYIPLKAFAPFPEGESDYYVIIREGEIALFPTIERAIRENTLGELHCERAGEDRACVYGRTRLDDNHGELKEGEGEQPPSS